MNDLLTETPLRHVIWLQEGFQYHHAERGYLMLTYWIPEGPCMLPDNASHQVGVGGFVVNEKNEVFVVCVDNVAKMSLQNELTVYMVLHCSLNEVPWFCISQNKEVQIAI